MSRGKRRGLWMSRCKRRGLWVSRGKRRGLWVNGGNREGIARVRGVVLLGKLLWLSFSG